MPASAWSYTSGTSDRPLLGLTIGDMFDVIAEPDAKLEDIIVPGNIPNLHVAPARIADLRVEPILHGGQA